ncbi:four helix bundle protein [Aestuariivirga litoralis]|uniref:four helix bundle protein n=1 Tax=Aestuariivirga litoralis TaxID=2650924 RepID=UPI0024851B11|nr:four helix bundle protein [Aestuariivirga litoralis]MBG1231846.1 four helix bundle protein [Aestuariivirga litoralis]
MTENKINSYRDLKVWQLAMDLAETCYALTGDFPKSEIFGMTSQIRRASVSIAANIAEGHGRETSPLFVQFLRAAQGSLKETETHLIICQRVGLGKVSQLSLALSKCDEIGKMLRSLIRSIQEK